jgi:hypothetical protein
MLPMTVWQSCVRLCVLCWLKIVHVSVQPTLHTGAVSPHASVLTNSIAHARSLSAMELQNAVAEAQNLAVQAAEAQNRVQQVAQVNPCRKGSPMYAADPKFTAELAPPMQDDTSC